MTPQLAHAIANFDSAAKLLGGCSDGYCTVTGRKGGQHTNGGCRCLRDLTFQQRSLIQAARRLRDALDDKS